MSTVKRNRRPINPAQMWTPILAVPRLDAYSTVNNRVDVSLTNALFGPTQPTSFLLVDAVTPEDSWTSTTAELIDDGFKLRITFPTGAVIADASRQLFIDQWNPGFRTREGGWIAPAIIEFDIPA